MQSWVRRWEGGQRDQIRGGREVDGEEREAPPLWLSTREDNNRRYRRGNVLGGMDAEAEES